MPNQDQRGHAARVGVRRGAVRPGEGRMGSVIVDCAIYRDGHRTDGP
ncbi:hypothetical protein GTW46_43355, partial [Streptomyces sp. SID6013]|nr:hypothetical protein [Streptomyces sp. SID6013]